MQFIDLAIQQKHLGSRLQARLAHVLETNQYILGPEVAELEAKLAAFAGARHCLSCASGSVALDLALMAWNIGPGDAVFTTPMTFISTGESIARTGATPVFIDIRLNDFNLDTTHLETALEAVRTKDNRIHPLPLPARQSSLTPKLVLPVDLFGHPANYDVILRFAHTHGLKVLGDAAQGFGATYKSKHIGGCGCDATATSFFPAKPLGCYGDGGAVFTDDDDMADLLDSLRYHGRADHHDKYNNVRLGLNGRLDTMQAAVLLAKFDLFPNEIILRNIVAKRYNQLLGSVYGVLPPSFPMSDYGQSVWAQYTILLPPGVNREKVRQFMLDRGVPTAVYYPRGLFLQGAFAYLGYRSGDFPITEEATARVLSLPMHPYLEVQEQTRVIQTLADALHSL